MQKHFLLLLVLWAATTIYAADTQDSTHISLTLNEVVVSANQHATRQQEASAAVDVVTPFVFENTTSCALSDALSYQSGLRVEQTCGNCGQPQLRINGLEGQYSQILLDSRPMFSSLASVYGLEQIPTAMIERVEIMRGGGSTLYGSNAVAGVVNIITKEPTHNFFNLSNTSQMIRHNAYDITTSVDGAILSPDRKIGAFLFAVQRNRSPYDSNGDGFSEMPKMNSTTAGTRVFFKTSQYSKLTVNYHHITDFRRGGNAFDLPPQQADIAEQTRHQIDAGGLRFDWYDAGGRHFVSAYADAQNIKRDSYFGADQDPNAFGNTHDLNALAGLQYRFSYHCGNTAADLTVGAEYSYNRLRDEMTGYNRLIKQDVHLAGGYVQNEWQSRLWSLLIGARVEKHNLLRRPVVAPRLNFRLTPIDGLALRAAYSSGYRAPQAYEEDLHVAAVGGEMQMIRLDDNLRPEYSHSATLSIDYCLKLGGLQADLMAEGFYTYLQDVFVLKENGTDAFGNGLLLRTNSDGAFVGGLNLEGRLTYKDWLAMQLGYTWQQSRYVQPEAWSDDVAPTRRMLRTPDNYAYMLLSIKPLHDLTIAVNGTVTGSMLVPHYAGYIPQDEQVATPVFCDFGARLAYDIHLYKHYCLELSLGVKNIFNQFQRDQDFGADKDSEYIYGPALPRTAFIGIKLKL